MSFCTWNVALENSWALAPVPSTDTPSQESPYDSVSVLSVLTTVLVRILAVNQPITIIKHIKNIKVIFLREIHFLSFKHGWGCFPALSWKFHCAIGSSFIQVLKNYKRHLLLSLQISGSFEEIWKRKYSENLKLFLF